MTVVIVAGGTVAARLETMLRGDPTLRVVVRDASALDGEPGDAVVILALPAEAAARALERLHKRPRRPAIIVLATRPQDAWTPRARGSGVRAVLGADVGAAELRAAVAAVGAGLLVLDPDAVNRGASTVARAPVAGALTSREVEVLEMLAEGMSNRAIAARLKIARNTVKFHVAAIFLKLGARTRTEAVTLGVRQGLISL
ncbi:MAG TPA: response regulator transcription factor [Methylomirabilota bacterium]|nr:response regulator transcription factor [Methylomirabilota bacterium]